MATVMPVCLQIRPSVLYFAVALLVVNSALAQVKERIERGKNRLRDCMETELFSQRVHKK